jgi:hypothetical protein
LLLFRGFGSKMHYIEIMWRTRLTTAALILAWLATPEILCLLPGVEMTADEHECCEQMGPDCGKVPMTDMHTCCPTPPPSHDVMVARMTDYPEQRVLLAPAVIPQVDLLYDNPQSVRWERFDNPASRPLVLRNSFDILRI